MQGDETRLDREVLVVLRAATATESLERLKRQSHVISVLPPRLVVLAPGASREALGSLPGVEAVLAQTPGEVPPSLTDAEQLFVSAWRARAEDKTRVGEGLPWDAPGFLPPDKPKGR